MLQFGAAGAHFCYIIYFSLSCKNTDSFQFILNVGSSTNQLFYFHLFHSLQISNSVVFSQTIFLAAVGYLKNSSYNHQGATL